MKNGDFGFKVNPLNICDIERKAQQARDITGFVNPTTKVIKIIEFVLPEVFGESFSWDPIDDSEMEGDLARTWPDQLKIHISNSLYEAACDGDPVANHTLAHELGHFFLHSDTNPSFAKAATPKYDSIFNSEWQADRFADFFLMPKSDVMATCQSVEDIVKRYRVTEEDARRHYRDIFGWNPKEEDQLNLF